MKISIANLKNKLRNGWELITSDSLTFDVKPGDEIDVEVHGGNKISISTADPRHGCVGSKRALRKITAIALRHPKNHDRCIAIDQVVVPKQTKPVKSKIRIIVGERGDRVNQFLAMYIYYKAIKTRGTENVSIATYRWEWRDGSPVEPFKELVGDTSDTEIICCGFESTAMQLSALDKFILVPYVSQAYRAEKKVSSLLAKLKTLGIYPELSLEDEKQKIYKVLNSGAYDKETIAAFVGRMTCVFVPEVAAKIITNPKSKFGVRQAFDFYMESDNEDIDIVELPMFSKDKELKNTLKTTPMSVSDYVLCNAVAVPKGCYIEVKADKDIYNDGYYFRITYPVSRTAAKLSPRTPIVVYTAIDRVDVYTNNAKITPAGTKILEAVLEEVLKDKNLKHIEIRRQEIQ